MTERLRSGAAGLDEVLDGGLPAHGINLIVGLPGTGKTMLAQQCAFENAVADAPAVYVSTIAEPFPKIVRYGQTLSFFDVEAVGRTVFYEEVGNALLHEGLTGARERLEGILAEREPALLVIDSLKAFATLAGSGQEYRRFLHELAGRLSIRPITSLWLGEYAVNDVAAAPEFAIADAVVWLTTGRYEQRETRLLQVLKLRGSDFLSGRHAYRLSAHGMRVFPRLADPAAQAEYQPDASRISSGVPWLDEALGQGLRVGSSTLATGPSGVGKTVLGLHFAFADAGRRDGTTVFATFDENPSQISEAAAGFGWSFERPEMRLIYRSAVDLYLDEWVYDFLEVVAARDTRRVFIDGLGSLRIAAHDVTRFQEYLYSLVQRFARSGVTVMMSLETADLFGSARLPDVPLSQMADNVLLLRFLREDGGFRRALTVLKSRGSRSEPQTHAYTVGASGIELREPQQPSRSW
jgi:circadian clock protein KaiC